MCCRKRALNFLRATIYKYCPLHRYFNRGSLPWQGLKAKTKKDKYNKISEKKVLTPIAVLCRNFPAEFATYMNYVRALRFDDQPDYQYLRRLFRGLLVRKGWEFDKFDWEEMAPKQNLSLPAPSGGPSPGQLTPSSTHQVYS